MIGPTIDNRSIHVIILDYARYVAVVAQLLHTTTIGSTKRIAVRQTLMLAHSSSVWEEPVATTERVYCAELVRMDTKI